MPLYTVKNANSPFFKWRQNQQKSRAGNLRIGYEVSGEVSGTFVIIGHSLAGQTEPPYCMYTDDLELKATGEIPTQPPSDVMYSRAGDIAIVLRDSGGNVISVHQNDTEVKWVRQT